MSPVKPKTINLRQKLDLFKIRNPYRKKKKSSIYFTLFPYEFIPLFQANVNLPLIKINSSLVRTNVFEEKYSFHQGTAATIM